MERFRLPTLADEPWYGDICARASATQLRQFACVRNRPVCLTKREQCFKRLERILYRIVDKGCLLRVFNNTTGQNNTHSNLQVSSLNLT